MREILLRITLHLSLQGLSTAKELVLFLSQVVRPDHRVVWCYRIRLTKITESEQMSLVGRARVAKAAVVILFRLGSVTGHRAHTSTSTPFKHQSDEIDRCVSTISSGPSQLFPRGIDIFSSIIHIFLPQFKRLDHKFSSQKWSWCWEVNSKKRKALTAFFHVQS